MVESLSTAMVLAAGFGKRMLPLTDSVPKPLVCLRGAALIDWTMARLRAGGVQSFVVNSHYLGDQIAAHFEGVDHVTLSPEVEILETGGGVKKALPLLGESPFFVTNSDTIWLDGAMPAVTRMRQAYDSDKMDILLLVHPTALTRGDYDGIGDFHMAASGQLTRRATRHPAPFVFAGLSILRPNLFDDAPAGAFSLNVLFDKAQASGRLFGLVHDGEWYHVGTPEALAETDRLIEQENISVNTR